MLVPIGIQTIWLQDNPQQTSLLVGTTAVLHSKRVSCWSIAYIHPVVHLTINNNMLLSPRLHIYPHCLEIRFTFLNYLTLLGSG